MTRTLTFVYICAMTSVIVFTSGDAFDVLPEALTFLGGAALAFLSTWAFSLQDQKLENLPMPDVAPPLPSPKVVVNSAQKLLVCVPDDWADSHVTDWVNQDNRYFRMYKEWEVQRLVNDYAHNSCTCIDRENCKHLFLVLKP